MRKLLNVGSLDQTKINTLSRWWNCQQKNLFVANKVPTHSGSNNWLTFFDGFYFIFQVSSWMFFKIFTIKLWTSKLITRWLLALKLQNLLKRRAKQQRWRLWYFVIICFPFFFAKAECTSVPKDSSVWTVIVVKKNRENYKQTG